MLKKTFYTTAICLIPLLFLTACGSSSKSELVKLAKGSTEFDQCTALLAISSAARDAEPNSETDISFEELDKIIEGLAKHNNGEPYFKLYFERVLERLKESLRYKHISSWSSEIGKYFDRCINESVGNLNEPSLDEPTTASQSSETTKAPDENDGSTQFYNIELIDGFDNYCQTAPGYGWLCFAQVLVTNNSNNVINPKFRAELIDSEGRASVPMDDPTNNLWSTFNETMNPGKQIVWGLQFSVGANLKFKRLDIFEGNRRVASLKIDISSR